MGPFEGNFIVKEPTILVEPATEAPDELALPDNATGGEESPGPAEIGGALEDLRQLEQSGLRLSWPMSSSGPEWAFGS